MTKPLPRADLAQLIAAQVSLHAAMTGFRMAAPLMALREGHSAAAVGMLLALFALAQVLLALPSGQLADRQGIRRPLHIAIGLATTGALLALAFPVFPVLCATALCCGAASCVTMTAVQRHAGKLAQSTAQLKQVFSWLAIGPSISNFVGPFLAGVLIDVWGFRAAYLLLALLPSLAWFWARGLTELPNPQAPAGASRGSAWSLLRQPDLRRLMLVNWMLSSCWDVHTFLVPVLGHERGLSASSIGAILGGFALAATAIRLLMPLLAARLRESVVIASAMLGTALLFAVYPLASSAWAMGGLSVLLGITLGSVQPMIMSTLHQITPAHRHGQALGLRALAINGSSVVMPLLFGSAGVVVGVAGVFWAVGAVVGAGARLALRLPSPSPPPPQRI
jgi:predicted MFS family arabinose efflux permease